MKRKATVAVHSNNKTPAKACDQQQQRLLHNFIGKSLKEDGDSPNKNSFYSSR